MLQVTADGVRWLARTGRLPYEQTIPGGQRVFRFGDVKRLADQRMLARLEPRASRLRAVRPEMLKADLEPRQLSLLPRLQLVGTRAAGERSLRDPEVQGAGMRRKRS